MDNTDYTTESRKGQHLNCDERHEIEIRLKDGWSIYRIAKSMNRAYHTISDEVARGTVLLYQGTVKRYKASVGEETYLKNRRESRRKYRCFEVAEFLRYVEKHFKDDEWSLDSCVGRALVEGFDRKKIVCTKTLYNYVDMGFLSIKNIDLPEKLRRNTKRSVVKANRKKLGRSIEERPESVDNREEFGHWEIDSVLGKKSDTEPVVISLTERMMRPSFMLKAENHSAEALDKTLKEFFSKFGYKYREVFKSITADNGSEFANLSNLEDIGIDVYFTHPYTSCEKGTVERHNRMLRRFIPKGKSIDDYSADDIMMFADIINGLPRKILGYRTPEELFEKELDRIYAT